MRRDFLLFGMLLGAWVGGRARAQEALPVKLPACEPGFKYVETVEYREVERRVCRVVPDKRTRWIYKTEPDYFCVPACPCCGHRGHDDPSCGTCPECNGPYCRQKLFKKLVEYECGTKCVVEVVKERVPCVVLRKVQCEPDAATAPEK